MADRLDRRFGKPGSARPLARVGLSVAALITVLTGVGGIVVFHGLLLDGTFAE